MISREFTINNKLGLHARPSAQITQVASRFASDIHIARNGRRVNAKSIMGVMMLAAECGATVNLKADGADADGALDALAALIASRFGEQ
jgi:phosphocarrier protein HPr